MSDYSGDKPSGGGGDGGSYVNKLTPPIGTTFFSNAELALSENDHVNVQDQLDYTITWRVQKYLYAANGDPNDRDFAKNGGKIYAIFVHSGNIRVGPQDLYKGKFHFDVNVNDDKRITPVIQLPPTGSGTKNSIDYEETLQMLVNEGQDKISFDATYKEDFMRTASIQNGTVNTTSLSFDMDSRDGKLKADSTHEIHAFSVFRCEDPHQWPATFEFSYEASADAPGQPTAKFTKRERIELPFKKQ